MAKFQHSVILVGALLHGLVACSVSHGGGDGHGGFGPADPTTGPAIGPVFGSGGSVASGGAGAISSPPTGEGAREGSGENRLIEEADLVRVERDRMYAVSGDGEVSVIDVGTRDQLQLLGQYYTASPFRLPWTTVAPFELYVRDSHVLVLYNDYGQYSRLEQDGKWELVTRSYVIALDASDPTHITETGRYVVPGELADSRLLGDVLYVVSTENAGLGARTAIVSLKVGSPAAIAKVDELSYDYLTLPSVAISEQRMYLTERFPNNGRIQVVDISDPGGDLELGATLEGLGGISNGSQMDEYEGVLRVISQGRLDHPPHVQTFTVHSSQQIEPLALLDLVAPEFASLLSVGFDGPRAYAITGEQGADQQGAHTDRPFVIDFSNPAAPVQGGELAMPGAASHLEARGDRVLGMGLDDTSSRGGFNVSLFDVSDPFTPRLLDRVNFGPMRERLFGEDTIHQAFTLLDAEGLIIAPIGANITADGCSFDLQLIDWSLDRLAQRGVVRTSGQAQRGFVHDQRLFAVSSDGLESYDLSDRDQPVEKASLAFPLVPTYDSKIVAADADKIVRTSKRWRTETEVISVTPLAVIDRREAAARVEIIVPPGSGCFAPPPAVNKVLLSGSRLYAIYYQQRPSPTGALIMVSRVVTIDVQDPTKPHVIGDAVLDFIPERLTAPDVITQGEDAVVLGSTLVFLRQTQEGQGIESELYVVNMANPNQPIVSTLPLAATSASTGLFVSGNGIALGHYAPASTPVGAQFYVERFDLSAGDPRALPTLNVPGSVIAYDAQSERIITVDYQSQAETLDIFTCTEKFARSTFVPNGKLVDHAPVGACTGILQSIQLVELARDRAVVLGSYDLDPARSIFAIARGSDRLFVNLHRDRLGKHALVAFSGLESGAFASGQLELGDADWGDATLMAASGERVALTGPGGPSLLVVEAEVVSAPTLLRREEPIDSGQLVTAGEFVLAPNRAGIQSFRLAD